MGMTPGRPGEFQPRTDRAKDFPMFFFLYRNTRHFSGRAIAAEPTVGSWKTKPLCVRARSPSRFHPVKSFAPSLPDSPPLDHGTVFNCDFVDARPHVRGRIQPVADLQATSPCHKAIHKDSWYTLLFTRKPRGWRGCNAPLVRSLPGDTPRQPPKSRLACLHQLLNAVSCNPYRGCDNGLNSGGAG